MSIRNRAAFGCVINILNNLQDAIVCTHMCIKSIVRTMLYLFSSGPSKYIPLRSTDWKSTLKSQHAWRSRHRDFTTIQPFFTWHDDIYMAQHLVPNFTQISHKSVHPKVGRFIPSVEDCPLGTPAQRSVGCFACWRRSCHSSPQIGRMRRLQILLDEIIQKSVG